MRNTAACLRDAFLLSICLSLPSVAGADSDIAPDEDLQFFTTVASFNEQERRWHLPIHGWVYEPASSWFRKALLARSLELKFGLELDQQTDDNFDRRISLLFADNERNKRVLIKLGDEEYLLPPSSANGHFFGAVTLSEAEARNLARDGRIYYSSEARGGREFYGAVQLLEPQGVSVISDIDDTIKITQVLDRRELLNNTFLQDFASVPGMAESYRKLAAQGASFHFVSSSPWQLYPDLWALLQNKQFPWATLHLKSIRFRDETFFALFQPGTETKPLQISEIISRFPERDFILIGDSGEADPEVYARILREFPERVRHIFIRNITDESLANERFKPLVDDPSRWTLFSDPTVIELPRPMGLQNQSAIIPSNKLARVNVGQGLE